MLDTMEQRLLKYSESKIKKHCKIVLASHICERVFSVEYTNKFLQESYQTGFQLAVKVFR